ncbi:minor capsid protein [Clostridium sp. 19966]|uniref:minor capsid protein n=1 Tax=Clostridium sp. 19966 TaxID=2768166 RepID=UPI0028E04612|nr:minor capsid protein [Clostridium sp. 19966]MDT8715449.1 minor capsid protein [Clostridium sp. 19966]
MAKNNKYWQGRADARMATYHKDNDTVVNTINRAYDKAISYINTEIKKIYDKFSIDGNLSPTEAKQILNSYIDKKEIEALKFTVSAIQDIDLKKYLLSRINAMAYKARITRLQALKESIFIESKELAETEIKQSTSGYIDTINNAYYQHSYDLQKGLGIGFNIAQLPSKAIQAILQNPWSGELFSSRVWKNTQVLADKLTEVITAGVMSGKSTKRMASEIEDLSEMGKMAANRLIRTETTYMANAAEMESYKAAQIEKYIFVATLDSRTSEICREHDGKIYNVKDGVAGKNLPPLHPWCRSTTIVFLDEKELENLKRRAKDPKTGKAYLVPANMSYNEWYKTYVIDKYGQDQADIMKKKVLNKSSDKSQFKEYQRLLKKEAPETLEAFQELKYNNSKEWKALKSSYLRTNKFNKIVKDSADLNIKGEVIKDIDRIDLKNYKFADMHINSERNHNVTKDMAQDYINNAVVAYSRWKGQVIVYVSEKGCSVVNLKDKIISTAYKSEEYDEKFKKILEATK